MSKGTKRRSPAPEARAAKRQKVELPAEEPDFPRGKSQLDTVSKRKLASLDDTEDVSLFSTQSTKASTSLDEQVRQRRKLEKKKVAKRLEEAKKALADKENVAPTHVSYKRLIPGSRLLACIVHVSDRELIVSLPNLLLGHIPLHGALRISEDSDEEEEEDAPSLARTYSVGQILMAAVVSVSSMQEIRATTALKSFELDNKELADSRRIELTLDSSVLYRAISAEDLAVNFVRSHDEPVNACIASKEDSGYVLDVGVAGMTAFLSFADTKDAFQDEGLQIGAYLPARVTKVHQNRRTCSLSFEAFTKGAMIDREIAIDAVLPGMLVKGRVTAIDKGAVSVHFLGLFDGSIDAVHLAKREDIDEHYHVGQQLRARILAALPWQSSKTFTLTDLPHLVAGHANAEPILRIGALIERASVTRVERHWGILLSLPNVAGPDLSAFAPIAELSDERIDEIPRDIYGLGSEVAARVIAYSALTGIYTVSLRHSVLQRRFMTASELQIGQLIEGTVQRLTAQALFVSIGSSNDAVVWPLHYSDTRMKYPERKFRPGSKLKARVFAIDAQRNRVSLTLKPSLVNSTLPIVASLQDATLSSQLAAIVSKLDPKGATCELFGGSRVFVPLGDLSYDLASHQSASSSKRRDDFIDKPEQAVSVGKAVELRVTGVVGGRLRATLRTKAASTEGKARSLLSQSGLSISPTPIEIDELEVGQVMPVRLVKGDMHGWLAQLSSNLRGRVHWTDTADNFDDAASLLEGQIVRAVIVKLDADAVRIDLSLRASLLSPEAPVDVHDASLASLDDLQTGMRVRGFVVNIVRAGLFVAIARQVTARVQIKELFDDFVEDWQSRFKQGQIVEGSLLKVDVDKEQVELRLRTGDSGKAKADGLAWSALQEGQQVRCHVKAFRAYGVLLAIEDSYISGLCHKTQMGDYEQDAMAVGQKLNASIVSVDQEKRRVGFSLEGAQAADAVEAEEAVDGFEEQSIDDESIDITLNEMQPAHLASQIKQTKPAAALELPATFAWTDDAPAPAEPSHLPLPTAKRLKRPSAATEAGTDDAPASRAEFEKEVSVSPNSSAAWIRYLKFCLDTADVLEARQVAKRALDSINYREEEEKLNIWMALLKLEIEHGTETTFEAAFTEAVRFNDALTVHLRLADVLELTGKLSEVAPMLSRSGSKFGSNVSYWLRLAKAHFRNSDNSAAHETLQRSLKSLSSKQHVEMISKFAQLEFKLGDAERGRTLFEGVLDKAPKRLDLWSVYADMEEQADHVEGARAIFGRMLDRKLSSKKAKFILKKWFVFEQEHGTTSTVEAVRQRAVAFVQAQDEEEGEGSA